MKQMILVLLAGALMALPLTAEEAPTAAAEAVASSPCGNGVVYDDGTVETGYGFVPSAKWGVVLQQFDSADFPSGFVDEVCVCWLRTRAQSIPDFNFGIVFYDDVGGRPAEKPFARVEAQVEDVIKGKENAGRVDRFEVGGVPVPDGPFYIGVRWNPSKAKFSFVCADHSPSPNHPAGGFQREDRAKGWDNMNRTRDSIFHGHRASIIRATAKPEGWEPPPGTTVRREASSTPPVAPTPPPAPAAADGESSGNG